MKRTLLSRLCAAATVASLQTTIAQTQTQTPPNTLTESQKQKMEQGAGTAASR